MLIDETKKSSRKSLDMYNKIGMHTDEYEISLNREIGVCRSKISWANKELARLEKTYGMPTQELVDGSVEFATIPVKECVRWREAAIALEVWRVRLCQYEDLYLQYKK